MLETFITNEQRQRIESIHDTFRGSPAKSLREEFALGHGYNWDSERNTRVYNDERFPQIIAEMREGAVDWQKYGLYDRAEIWKLRSIAEFIPVLDKYLPGALDDISSVRDLESISEMCQIKRSSLLAIKAYVLANGFEDSFFGYHPQTYPVKDAEQILFGRELTRQEHRDYCRDASKILGLSPTGVNTYLWVVGWRLNNKPEKV